MEQKLLSDCHPITHEKPAKFLEENVEGILQSCRLHSINVIGDFVRTFANMQETIDSKYFHKNRWLSTNQSCQHCLHLLENNQTEMRTNNLCNPNVTYLQDIFIIEPTHSSHCTADLKINIHFIQDEISLFFVDENGIDYVDRRSTHRLHSIIYYSSELTHFIARFQKGEDVYEYDGMNTRFPFCVVLLNFTQNRVQYSFFDTYSKMSKTHKMSKFTHIIATTE
jgi:hypothetical protein